jgi:uncharacterized integral membrane protein
MINGVLERLFIVRQNQDEIILREYPFKGWLVALGLVLLALNLSALNLVYTAITAATGAVIIALVARMRVLTFHRTAGTFRTELLSPLCRTPVLVMPLSDIAEFTVEEDERGGSQIILNTTSRQRLGFSVYSRDIADWKTPIAEALNDFLA